MTFRQSVEDTKIFSRHINTTTDLNDFANHVVRLGASDLILQTYEPAIILVHGKPIQISRYRLQPSQIDIISSLILNNQNIKSTLAGGNDYDHAFDIPDQDHSDDHGVPRRHRFRLNATAIGGKGNDNKQLVMRHIPADPPTLQEITFPEELYTEFALEQGMFVIAGETGSGKTTTFAACKRYILEGNTHIQGNILTYEKPIEFMFDGIQSATCVIAQSEVGVHIPSFAAGVRNSLRRKPSLVVVGEMRDYETISAANNVAIQGHPVFGTVHANDSSLVIRRMVMEYEYHQQAQAYAEISGNMRLIVSQSLAPNLNDDGRVCLRDYIILDPNRAEILLDAGPMGSVKILREWQEKNDRARSMKTSINEAYKQGQITADTARRWLRRYGYNPNDL